MYILATYTWGFALAILATVTTSLLPTRGDSLWPSVLPYILATLHEGFALAVLHAIL